MYNPQALPGSLKFRTWCFSLTLYTEYEAIQALKISMTRLDTVLKQLHISLWNILIFYWKIFYLHLQSSSASKKWKNANVVRFAGLVHRVRRDPSVTLRKFSPDTTGHGLQITKRPAVWYFSIFLFEKYQFLLEVFCLPLKSSSASRKLKNLNIVLFADSSQSEEIQAWHFSSDSSRQNSKYCKETVKWHIKWPSIFKGTCLL